MVFNKKLGAVELFKPVIMHCNRIFYLIPQILVRMRDIFGEEFYNEHIAPKVVFLPNIVERVISDEELKVKRGLFLTVLRMTKKSIQRKNLKRLLLALKLVQRNNVKLKIIGDGEYKSAIDKWVSKFGLNEKVIFEGPVKNEKINFHY